MPGEPVFYRQSMQRGSCGIFLSRWKSFDEYMPCGGCFNTKRECFDLFLVLSWNIFEIRRYEMYRLSRG
jgi:hypothetical protein